MSEAPQPGFVAEKIEAVRSIIGPETPDADILQALCAAGNDPDEAINILLDAPVTANPLSMPDIKVKVETDNIPVNKEENDELSTQAPILGPEFIIKKEEPIMGSEQTPILVLDDYVDGLATTTVTPDLNPQPIKPAAVSDRRLQVVRGLHEAEIAEFPEEVDWFLVEKKYLKGLSTCRGRGKLEANEVVHFAFPSSKARNSKWVRFSTKRSGEIGKLPEEWSRCLIRLMKSSKVKVQGRCVIPPHELSLMKEISLYVNFYIHSSIFTQGDKSSFVLPAPSRLKSTVHLLPTLFKLLKTEPFKKADFTPEELVTSKPSLKLEDADDDKSTQIVGLAKRQKGGKTYPEQTNEEQVTLESSLNELVGAAEVYNLQEADPPCTLMCNLWPYQKQALYWMSEVEKGIDAEKAGKTLHPFWSAYNISDRRASAVYVNVFSGEATTQFPSATTRGGILADAMGLGKTVTTIALILGNPSRGKSDDQDKLMESKNASDKDARKASKSGTTCTVKGGTLVVSPMALLGQWKDELETHSKPGSISIFVHYGGDRTNDPKVIAQNDVVLTTYGVLASAYKNDLDSIFHKIEWYRVVLDEAHTIKSPKAQVSRSAFALTSHCRWCLTGTPLQNDLKDLYSLLRFLNVEPWCNWDWWKEFIQYRYCFSDERCSRLVKAVLRPLMLRRTKDTKDKEGRPILVLPPATIEIVECEYSEAERDFYEALFKSSKVKFDQFVAKGKVLDNYASILEELLRLRQCCNHPFLALSRGDTQEYSDLNKLARKFLEGSQHNSSRPVPSAAYVESVVECLRRGEQTECPICLELPTDPVLTPCAHQMCRECLLSSWCSPSDGPCPICRSSLKRTDLITCPSERRFQVDVETKWTESSKILKLIECLESIQKSGSGEKSIVFSQWTAFLDLLEIPLGRKMIGYLRFDGKVQQKERERVLKEFNESTHKMVLLMSLKAGGVGLNLTAASNVFLMDPWWNPAVEEQAITRVHRIGQKRHVRVKRFIVKNTVEEKMQQMQAMKQRMITGALTDEVVWSSRLDELKMLFG